MEHPPASEQGDIIAVDNHVNGLNLAGLLPRITKHIEETIQKLAGDPDNHVGLLIIRGMDETYRDALSVDVRDEQEISDVAFYMRHMYRTPTEIDFSHVNAVRVKLGLSYIGPEDRLSPNTSWGASQG